VIGQLAYPAIGFLFTSLYLSMDYIDWPACRHQKSSGYRWAFLKSRFMAAFGFGTGVFILLMIPGINLLFMPAAVAGGTLLFLDVEGIRGESPKTPMPLES
jgi:CysZ protein